MSLIATGIFAILMALGGVTAGIIQANSNKDLQEDAQAFNAQEAATARAFSANEAEIARQFQRQEAQTTRDWEKMMSDTSYQRAVKDMQLAGINPASIGVSSGASTPVVGVSNGFSASSPSASINAINNNGMAQAMTSMFGSAMTYAMRDKEFRTKLESGFYQSADTVKRMAHSSLSKDSYWNASNNPIFQPNGGFDEL